MPYMILHYFLHLWWSYRYFFVKRALFAVFLDELDISDLIGTYASSSEKSRQICDSSISWNTTDDVSRISALFCKILNIISLKYGLTNLLIISRLKGSFFGIDPILGHSYICAKSHQSLQNGHQHQFYLTFALLKFLQNNCNEGNRWNTQNPWYCECDSYWQIRNSKPDTELCWSRLRVLNYETFMELLELTRGFGISVNEEKFITSYMAR